MMHHVDYIQLGPYIHDCNSVTTREEVWRATHKFEMLLLDDWIRFDIKPPHDGQAIHVFNWGMQYLGIGVYLDGIIELEVHDKRAANRCSLWKPLKGLTDA